jgi:hypothetical protein
MASTATSVMPAVVRGGFARLTGNSVPHGMSRIGLVRYQRKNVWGRTVRRRFHRSGAVIDFVDVVDAADVRVRHLTCHPHFGVELCQPSRIPVDVGRQKLQRDGPAELQIVSTKHFAHPAATKSLDDPVAAAEEGAGLEAAVVDRARG